MTKEREALKLALDALEKSATVNAKALKLALELALDVRANASVRLATKAIALTGVLDAALAEQPAQQQEPVVVRDKDNVCYQYTYLPQHKQEPVAWTPKIERHYKDGVLIEQTIQYNPQSEKLPYPQRTWVGLTDVEIASACKKNGGAEWWWRDIEEFARAIEAKLKEKNNG